MTQPPLTPIQVSKTEWSDFLTETRFLMTGVVLQVGERRDKPPMDGARTLFMLSSLLLVLPLMLSFCLAAFVGVGVVVIGLTALGLGSLLICLGPMLGIPTLLMSLFGRRGPPRDVAYVEMRVAETGAGRTVNLTLIDRRQGGMVSQGDEIEAWGRWDDKTRGSGRVWRVNGVSAAGALGQQRTAGYVIRGMPPFPRWAAVTLLVITLLVIGLVYLPMFGVGPKLWQP